MKTQRHAARARVAVAGVAAGVLLAGCGAANESAPAGGAAPSAGAAALSGTISGAGASSQEAAMQAWIAGFTGANPDVTVNYDPVGSGGGREQFIAGGVAFAGSDSYLNDEELTDGAAALRRRRRRGPDLRLARSRSSTTSRASTDLQLSPATLAGIFTGEITKWNDAAIAADNPGTTLPDQAITPVHRSDESGTTENFTDYLTKAAPDVWTAKAAGTWPVQGGEAAQGTSGVVGAVQGGNGTIGYADASQAGDLGMALVEVGDAVRRPDPGGRRERPRRVRRGSRAAARAASPSTSTATPPRPAPTRSC